jgi:hypothetical protein
MKLGKRILLESFISKSLDKHTYFFKIKIYLVYDVKNILYWPIYNFFFPILW